MTNLKGGIESYIMNIYRNLEYNKIIFDFICDFSEIAYYEEIKKMGQKFILFLQKERIYFYIYGNFLKY